MRIDCRKIPRRSPSLYESHLRQALQSTALRRQLRTTG
jgi:hypothetical protein